MILYQLTYTCIYICSFQDCPPSYDNLVTGQQVAVLWLQGCDNLVSDDCAHKVGTTSYIHVHVAGNRILKALGHDISKRFVTKFKRIVRGPSFR